MTLKVDQGHSLVMAQFRRLRTYMYHFLLVVCSNHLSIFIVSEIFNIE